ncbi:G kinase-anchoring protein 1-like [Neocloeon triangulifer]|uniref:G kinase-anchoring protein 1-like n=1 Tax=Neocloeon triangulifer TaxID=2078957 RepID=UPI00286F88DA|nr:G kinase-anchoring protein 1-like [Neocloeon triangulifer]
MATAVASRFAVLSLDVEDDNGKVRKAEKKKAADSSKDKTKTQPGKQQQQQQDAKKKASKKKSDSNSQSSSKSKSGPAGQQQKQAKQTANSSQWEDWKKKDQEFVSESYEQDLQEAVLQSKLEFEEVRKLRKAAGLDDNVVDKSKKKGKPLKPQPMSLETFNKMSGDGNKKEEIPKEEAEEYGNFFEKINEYAAEAMNLELKTAHFKARQVEPQADVHVTLAQFQDVLDKRNKEIVELKELVTKLEFELSNVKARNSKLCAMLAQGEMKDKVDVLLEVEKLKTAREELSSEVQSLYGQLEQERSKVSALSQPTEKGKSKGKK